MARQKLSVSLEEDVVERAKAILKEGKFRNMSHIIEYALRRFLTSESKVN